jgi:hypothetical protein
MIAETVVMTDSSRMRKRTRILPMNFSSRHNKSTLLCCSLVLFLFVLAQGCSLLRKGAEPALILVLSIDRPTYRPGDAVIANVQVLNTTGHEYTIQNLNAKSLSFWLINADTDETHKLEPVYTEKEDMIFPRTLGEHEAISRPFLLSEATTTSGTYSLHAIYEGALVAENKAPFVPPSKRVVFRVEGERQFSRDLNGILKKDDAIELARRAVGEPATLVDATLVKNEAGFLDWWITLQIKQSSGNEGKEVKRAFLINPYLGAVRKEVSPLEKQKSTEEKTIIPPLKRTNPLERSSEVVPEAQPRVPTPAPRKP